MGRAIASRNESRAGASRLYNWSSESGLLWQTIRGGDKKRVLLYASVHTSSGASSRFEKAAEFRTPPHRRPGNPRFTGGKNRDHPLTSRGASVLIKRDALN